MLRRLKEKGITLDYRKCAFAEDGVKFLEHVINKDVVGLDRDKIANIVDTTLPTNITELKRFFGHGRGELPCVVYTQFGNKNRTPDATSLEGRCFHMGQHSVMIVRRLERMLS